jgi:hypothetical protein
MKKVLIITYHFPPQLAAGAQRPHKLAKYLPEFGWKPIVLTPNIFGVLPEGIHTIATDYKDVVTSLRASLGINSQRSMHEQIGIKVTKNYSYPTVRGKLSKLPRT